MGSTAAVYKKRTAAALLLLGAVLLLSLLSGKYPLSLQKILEGDLLQRRIFLELRLGRTLCAAVGGAVLGVSGFVFQTAFRNPLAAPDMIGVSSGAGAGAAAGLLLFGGTAAVTASAFAGALLALCTALGMAAMDRSGRNGTVVLAGIAVHALAQTVLTGLKLLADPEKELASLEYWLMGSLSDCGTARIGSRLLLCAVCLAVLFLLYRQILLLSSDADEARLLGVPVTAVRFLTLGTAALAVAAVISLTGLISFIGLLAPHLAGLFAPKHSRRAMLMSGVTGAFLLCAADLPARMLADAELPISLFTGLLGAPFLLWVVLRGRDKL